MIFHKYSQKLDYYKQITKKINFSFIIFFLCIFAGTPFSYLKAYENKKSSNLLTIKKEFLDEDINSQYILDSGDLIKITFKGIDGFSGSHLINPEGYINLPEIEDIYVRNLTKNELKNKLLKKYIKYIIDPDITVEIIEYRPVSFYVHGEINYPGLYSLEYIGRNTSIPVNAINTRKSGRVISPKIFDALKKAKGVTNSADLSRIKVIRKNSDTNGGGKIQAQINLLDLLLYGNQSQNIRIFDGDSIFIPKAKKLIKDQIIAVSKTNLNPDLITVYVTGNVFLPGPQVVKKGSSLNQTIATSGGKKLLTGNIEFIRFNDDGSTKKNKFRFNQNSKVNSYSNPILMDGDVINVNRGIIGTATELLKDISNPILSGYGLYSLFE